MLKSLFLRTLPLLIVVLYVSGISLVFIPGASQAVAASILIVAAALSIAANRKLPQVFTTLDHVAIDAMGVTREFGMNRSQCIKWDDLTKVSIVTKKTSLYEENLFFLLQDQQGNQCLVPNDQAQHQKLLPRLMRLPRFDHNAIVRACASSTEDSFICWEGTSGEATPAAFAVEA